MSGVYVPPRRDTSALTTILKGLSIAKDLYGMKVDSDKLEMMQQEHEAKMASDQEAKGLRDDLAAGRMSKGDQLALRQKGYVDAKKGDAGAFGYVDKESGQEVFIKPPSAAEKPMILPAGASLVQGGKIVTTAPKARGDGAGGAPLVQVETVDKDGNPIITFVRKQEGVSVPVSKPATAAAQKATNEAQYRYKSLIGNAAKLKQLVRDHGTMELTGSAGSDMDRAIYEMAIDYAKLVDPESIAREGEVAAAQKYMLGFRNNLGATTRNSTALEQIDGYLSGLNDRLKARASSYGDKSDQAIVDVQRSNKDASGLVEKANAAESGGDPEVTKYASEHSIDYDSAAKILISRGWKPK